MTQNNDPAMMEEVVLPEHLLPLGSVLGQGVSALDLCMVRPGARTGGAGLVSRAVHRSRLAAS